MIEKLIASREEFKDEVKNFCSNNNIKHVVVYSISYYEGVIGTPQDIQLVEEFVKKLEEERSIYRKNKGFWWRLWN
jgi:hypothetical protein